MLYITFSFNSPHKQQLWLFFLFFFRMQEGKGQKIVFSCLVLQPYSIRARKRTQVCLSLLAHILSTRKSCYFLIPALRSDHYLSMAFPLLTGKPTQISLSKTENLFAQIIGNSRKNPGWIQELKGCHQGCFLLSFGLVLHQVFSSLYMISFPTLTLQTCRCRALFQELREEPVT